MNGQEFLEKMELVDSKFVEEAIAEPRKKKPFGFSAAIAAAFIFAVLAGVFFTQKNDINIRPASSTETNNSAESESNSQSNAQKPPASIGPGFADMVGFFIYEGRTYIQYEPLENPEGYVGEYLGYSTGLIDEWSDMSDFVELSGSMEGEIYEMKDYNKNFLLLIKCIYGEETVYNVCFVRDGVEFKKGAELFEEALHCSEFLSATFESRESWFYSKNEIKSYPKSEEDKLRTFLSGCNVGDFVPLQTIPHEASIFDEKEIFLVTLETKRGLKVTLRLFDGGYVAFMGNSDICVKLDEEDFNSFVSVLESVK